MFDVIFSFFVIFLVLWNVKHNSNDSSKIGTRHSDGSDVGYSFAPPKKRKYNIRRVSGRVTSRLTTVIFENIFDWVKIYRDKQGWKMLPHSKSDIYKWTANEGTNWTDHNRHFSRRPEKCSFIILTAWLQWKCRYVYFQLVIHFVTSMYYLVAKFNYVSVLFLMI